MSGPPPKPTALKKLQGNPGKRALNKNEPQPTKKAPTTPKHFNKQQKYWYKRLCEEFGDMGVLTVVDGKALELLVDTYVEWREHCDIIKTEGYIYYKTSGTGDRIPQTHPSAIAKSDAAKRLKALLAEFGATPASRSKVEVEKAQEVDPVMELLNRKK